jgi:hypothetical protein
LWFPCKVIKSLHNGQTDSAPLTVLLEQGVFFCSCFHEDGVAGEGILFFFFFFFFSSSSSSRLANVCFGIVR